VVPVSAGEDFSAIRRFLDSTSPMAAHGESADPASPQSQSELDHGHEFGGSESGQRSVVDLLGREVVDPQGEVLGEVEDLVVNRNGRIVGVIVSHGGFLGFWEQLVGVRWSQVSSIGEAVELKPMPSRIVEVPASVPRSQALPDE
jgi:sporulation protein YlmC with PRC-barrel domain